jgi:hypothetical protein
MDDLTINPLDYATQFTFPASDGSEVEVVAMVVPGKWMITKGMQVLTVDNAWVSFRGLSPSNPTDVDLVGFDRDRAIAVAHRYANR